MPNVALPDFPYGAAVGTIVNAEGAAAFRELIESGRRISTHMHVGKDVWRALAQSSSVWFLCLAYFSNSYGSYFVMPWLPSYLAEQRGFQMQSLSFFSG